MELPDGWYDGEIIMPGEDGRRTSRRCRTRSTAGARSRSSTTCSTCPTATGHDLRDVPLVERRARAAALIVERKPHPNVRFSDVFDVAPRRSGVGLPPRPGRRDRQAARLGLRVRRATDWIKLKCKLRQEFVIGGWTDPQGARTGIGALLGRARRRRQAALRRQRRHRLQRADPARPAQPLEVRWPPNASPSLAGTGLPRAARTG